MGTSTARGRALREGRRQNLSLVKIRITKAQIEAGVRALANPICLAADRYAVTSRFARSSPYEPLDLRLIQVLPGC